MVAKEFVFLISWTLYGPCQGICEEKKLCYVLVLVTACCCLYIVSYKVYNSNSDDWSLATFCVWCRTVRCNQAWNIISTVLMYRQPADLHYRFCCTNLYNTQILYISELSQYPPKGGVHLCVCVCKCTGWCTGVVNKAKLWILAIVNKLVEIMEISSWFTFKKF